MALGTTLTVCVTDLSVRVDGDSRLVLWGDEIGPADLASLFGRLPAGVGVQSAVAIPLVGISLFTVVRRALGKRARGIGTDLVTQPDAAAHAAALAEVERRQRAVEAAERAEARARRRQWAEVAAVDGAFEAALFACEEAPLPGR